MVRSKRDGSHTNTPATAGANATPLGFVGRGEGGWGSGGAGSGGDRGRLRWPRGKGGDVGGRASSGDGRGWSKINMGRGLGGYGDAGSPMPSRPPPLLPSGGLDTKSFLLETKERPRASSFS